MKHFTLLCACLLSCTLFSQQAYNIAAPYDPATVKLAEELRGEIIRFDMNNSQRYPGTTREILVYVPQQYKDTAPACLLVCMDGILYDATTVLDNLIATGEMPVTIGVFINPGVVYDEDNNVVRYNRCKEFDSTDDTWAQFIEQEVLPQVTALKTTDGRSISISADPNDRAITGASSGGIAAFTAAWNRPDMFSRVYTTVGTFVAMRGGHEYPAIVRKTEPKPLRIYMQDGWYDVWNPIFGEWV
jgi:enterochelin esterase-like enzyme